MGWGSLKPALTSWCCGRSGATAIEYALIAAGVSLALAACIFIFGNDIGQFFLDMAAALS